MARRIREAERGSSQIDIEQNCSCCSSSRSSSAPPTPPDSSTDTPPIRERTNVMSCSLVPCEQQSSSSTSSTSSFTTLSSLSSSSTLISLSPPNFELPSHKQKLFHRHHHHHHRNKHLPIVACTGSVLDKEKDKCRQHGMDGFLTKPYRMEEMRLCIEELVGIETDDNCCHDDHDNGETLFLAI